ncbi:MAG: glycosyltransferase family 2 protein [Flavobacteriales bacterium]|jgi:glycosyltransferase involved in cell wall biosynthesis|tara:strand:+ start:702 stop:1391 length:690 start_codon:yes stop_codon:yes gene_type:complete
MKPIVNVVIPAFNEENAVGKVIAEIPKELVTDIIVVDNNSSDKTQEIARNAGATVLEEKFQGYGASCLRGLSYIAEKHPNTDIVVFIDADYSDYPEDMIKIVDQIINHNQDLVIGSRALGNKENGSMTIPQIFGNWLATFLVALLYKQKFTDLGPFRAIGYQKLLELNMQDRTYGWTVEMQIKAAKLKFKCVDVPVDYRVRVGVSKISGTIKGTLLAGYKIITTIFKSL